MATAKKRKARTKTEKKLAAQDMIMHGVGNVLGYWEGTDEPWEGMTEEDKEEFHAVLREQADRVARLFGFESAWNN